MLRSLQIFNCEITDSGAGAVGAAVASMPCLRKLELAYNRISHDGFRLITEWLLTEGSRNRLTDINIDGNVCGDEITESIQRLLLRGPFLQRLFLRGNFLTMPGLLRMIELVQEHENLIQVELGGNLEKTDKAAKRELDYLGNLLEERFLFLGDEAAGCAVDPLASSLYSVGGERMTPGITSPASPLAHARALFDAHSRSLPIAAQVRLARLAAYSSPINGYSPRAAGLADSPVRQHWKAGSHVA